MPYSEKLKALLEKVGAAQTYVVLSVLYFLVGAPVALFMKLRGHDPLMPSRDDGSCWQDRKAEERTVEDFMRQY